MFFISEYACSYTNDAVLSDDEALKFMRWVAGKPDSDKNDSYETVIEEEKLNEIRGLLTKDVINESIEKYPQAFRLRRFCDLLTFKIKEETELMNDYENYLWTELRRIYRST